MLKLTALVYNQLTNHIKKVIILQIYFVFKYLV